MAVRSGTSAETRGQWFAFLLFLAIIAGGIYLLDRGREVAGYVGLATGVVGPIALFIAAKKYKQRDLAKKWEQLAGR